MCVSTIILAKILGGLQPLQPPLPTPLFFTPNSVYKGSEPSVTMSTILRVGLVFWVHVGSENALMLTGNAIEIDLSFGTSWDY